VLQASRIYRARSEGFRQGHSKPVTADPRHVESRAHPSVSGRKWICASGEEVRRHVDVKWQACLSVSIEFDVHSVLEQGHTFIDLFDVDTAVEQFPQPRQVLVLHGKVCRCHRHPSRLT
jgi:hypothetical protein